MALSEKPVWEQESRSRLESRPVVVYLHRYPPEVEALQYSAMRKIIDCLLVKYDVLYICMKGHRPVNPEIRRGMQVMELPVRVDHTSSRDKWLKTAFYYLLLPVILRYLKKVGPALIICKETLPFVPSVVGLLRIPMLIAVSDWWWSIFFSGSALGRRVARLLEHFEVRQWNRFGARVVANSRAEAQIVARRGMNECRIEVVNAPVVSGVFFPRDATDEREKLGFDNDVWVVGIHGIIRRGKGYGQVLQWWQDLVKLHPHWRLLIIGGAGGETWCRRIIEHLDLERHVVMTGWLPTQDDVNRHLNAADCLLVVRRNSEDNIGIIPSALYHSLATGRPTVATGLPGISEIIRSGMDGFLFQPDNYASFKSILEYIEAHPEIAAKVGSDGIDRARQCFNENMAAERHAQLIDQMLDRAGSG